MQEPKKEIKSIKLESNLNQIKINPIVKKVENIINPSKRLSLSERKALLNKAPMEQKEVKVDIVKEIKIEVPKEPKVVNLVHNKKKKSKEKYTGQYQGKKLSDYYLEQARILKNNEFILIAQKYKDVSIECKKMLHKMYVVDQLKNLEDTHPRLIEHRELLSTKNTLEKECEYFLKK